jgi:phenylacetate-CoA ligase
MTLATLVLGEKSTLQNLFLKKLIGRTNDVAVLPSGKKSPGLTFLYHKSIIEEDGNVKNLDCTNPTSPF